MLKLLKQFKKQTEHISDLTKFIINTLSPNNGRSSLHTLRFYVNKHFGSITNATFKYCLSQAIEYYSRDFKINMDKNNLYFKNKDLLVGVA